MSKGPNARALVGVFVFIGLLVLCFGFALVLLSHDEPLGGLEGPRVGVVEIEGLVARPRRALEALRGFRRRDSVRAIVVRINTPGGPVGPAQEIYREIERTRRTKPVVASLGAVAASGGYYLASACNKIVANPGTLTGSIGVIAQTTDLAELVRLLRIRTSTIKTGPFKDTGSPLRPMTEEDRVLLQGLVDEIHARFISDVAKGRGLKRRAVAAMADGRVITGERALDLKLVDQLGNMSDALDLAAKLAKVQGDPIAVYPPRSGGLLGQLLRGSAETLAQRLRSELNAAASIETRDPRLTSAR